MRQSVSAIVASTCLLSVAWGQTTIIDTDFSEYADGNLAGQSPWISVPGLNSNPFNVTGGEMESITSTNLWKNDYFIYIDPASSAGSAVDDQWNGEMDYSFHYTASNMLWQAKEFLYVGTSTTSTNLLRKDNADDVVLNIGSDWGDEFTIRTYDETGEPIKLLSITNLADIGFTPSSEDQDSDTLRIKWSIRKTRTEGYFTVNCSVSNALNQASYEGMPVVIKKVGAYAATEAYQMIGRNDFRRFWDAANEAHVYIESVIDNLKITATSGNVPVELLPPEVSGVGGISQVELSWIPSVDSDSYEVLRSTSTNDIDFSSIASGITTNGYLDTQGLINGITYYYKVTARATGLDPATSEIIAVTPNEPQTGNIIDVHFSDAEGYTAADLAGQDKWKAIAASDPMAFIVDPAGSGWADTAPIADVEGSTNQVYWADVMVNSTGAVWTGRIEFSLTANGVTNITRSYLDADGITTNDNTQMVAELGGDHSLMFGLTANRDQRLDPLDVYENEFGNNSSREDDVLISVYPTQNGNVTIGINMYAAHVNNMLTLTAEELGWDPAWVVNAASNTPDMASDTIQLDFMIRKATALNSYVGQVTATINGAVYESDMVYTKDAGGWAAVDVAYAAELLYFGLSRSAADLNSRVDVMIDSLSLTHTNASDIPLVAPYELEASSKDLGTLLNWTGTGEQESFEVWRSGGVGGPYDTFITNVTEMFTSDYLFTDADENRTYFYVLKAVYPGDERSDFSDEISSRIKKVNKPFNLNGDFSTRTWKGAWGNVSQPEVANGIEFRTGIGSYTGMFGEGSLFTTENNHHTNNISSAPYGVFQTPEGAGAFEMATQANGAGAADMIKQTIPAGSSSLLWVEGAPTDVTVGTFSISMESAPSADMHAAIRNGSTWYVCERTQTEDVTKISNLVDENWIELELATATSTEFMSVKGLSNYVAGVDLNLTDVNAVGVFRDTDSRDGALWWWGFELTYGTIVTPYQNWCDGQGIYNEDAASTNDVDGDGLNNRSEWGFGGNPTDPYDVGITERRIVNDADGMVLYVHPVLQGSKDERPVYTVETVTDLVYGDFMPMVPSLDPVEGGAWPGEPGFNCMTNFVPVDADQKFIRVIVE